MEIIALHNDLHADYNIFKTTEELLEHLSGDIPEMQERKKAIEKALAEYPDFQVYRWTSQTPKQGIKYEDSKIDKLYFIKPLYFCRSADDNYTTNTGATSYTWSAYYLFKDMNVRDSDHRKIYQTTDGINVVLHYYPGSPMYCNYTVAENPVF